MYNKKKGYNFICFDSLSLLGFTCYESFAAVVSLLQIRLIKMILLCLLTHGKFHELQFV